MAEVVDVETAIPGFVGYTAIASTPGVGGDLHLTPTTVRSFIEFEAAFGGPSADPVAVDLKVDPASPDGYSLAGGALPAPVLPRFLLYWSVRMFFDNGGRICRIVSVGGYSDAPSGEALLEGLTRIASVDDVTILVVPDAATISTFDAYTAIVGAMLQQCAVLRDRVALLDVWKGGLPPDATVDVSSGAGNGAQQMHVIDASRLAWREHLEFGAAYYPFLITSFTRATTPASMVKVTVAGAAATTLEEISVTDAHKANAVRAALASARTVLPPSGAVAGVYAVVDATRGVWKAPTAVALVDVREPAVQIGEAAQQRLSGDPIAGKSINAIRAFPGKGTLVWGARTLASNDNEWRYVSVRRLFIMVEESIRKSTEWAVFESNDAALWTQIRAIIETYLVTKWRDGALMGATSKDAFYVRCGLGTTMTQQDIVNGRLLIEIGMAPVRPAEFIIVRISHQMQRA